MEQHLAIFSLVYDVTLIFFLYFLSIKKTIIGGITNSNAISIYSFVVRESEVINNWCIANKTAKTIASITFSFNFIIKTPRSDDANTIPTAKPRLITVLGEISRLLDKLRIGRFDNISEAPPSTKHT